MDTRQARFVLQSWRASGADADDPQFSVALREMKRDAELTEWFEHEQALDHAIGRKLGDFPAPDQLRATILAEHFALPTPAPRRRWTPLALAAALAFLAALAGVWYLEMKPKEGFAACRAQMMENLSSLRLDFASANLTEVQRWLFANREISGYSVPSGLQKLPSIGCKIWTWRGKPVALICFSLKDGHAVHLFVIPRSALVDPPGSEPQFARQADWMTGSWTDRDFVYVVARRGQEGSLKELLGPKA